jgi:hypothetical protein
MLGCQWHRFQRSILVWTAECLRLSESWPVPLEVSAWLTVRGGCLGASRVVDGSTLGMRWNR